MRRQLEFSTQRGIQTVVAATSIYKDRVKKNLRTLPDYPEKVPFFGAVPSVLGLLHTVTVGRSSLQLYKWLCNTACIFHPASPTLPMSDL